VKPACETVVVRLPNHVGDVCMALPALRLLTGAGLSVVIAGKPWAQSLLAGMGWDFVALEGRVWADAQRLRAAARTHEARRALVLPNSLGSALACRLAGLSPAGLDTDARGLLLAVRLPAPRAAHEVERFFTAARGALRGWGYPPPADQPLLRLGLKLTDDDRATARAALAAAGVPRPFALLAPLARGTHHGQAKHWPHFGVLPRLLAERGLATVAAPPSDEVAATRAALPDAVLLPPLPLGVFAALAAEAALVIANDSGTSHVAAAVGAPQVTIVGVTDPARTGPWSPAATVVGREGAWPTVDQVTVAIDAKLAGT
jgi:heptosyltransferase-2